MLSLQRVVLELAPGEFFALRGVLGGQGGDRALLRLNLAVGLVQSRLEGFAVGAFGIGVGLSLK